MPTHGQIGISKDDSFMSKRAACLQQRLASQALIPNSLQISPPKSQNQWLRPIGPERGDLWNRKNQPDQLILSDSRFYDRIATINLLTRDLMYAAQTIG